MPSTGRMWRVENCGNFRQLIGKLSESDLRPQKETSVNCGQLKVEVLVMKGDTVLGWLQQALSAAFFLNSHPGLIQTMVSKRNLLGAEHPDLTPKAEMRASLDPINRKHKMKPTILWRLSAQRISGLHSGSKCKVTHHVCADIPRPPKF